MNRIEYVSSWESGQDRLDGRPIRSGEKLRVNFPDGDPRVVTVHVMTTHGSYSDHGHEHRTEQQRAYCRAAVYGVEVLVPLVGLEAERVA